MIQFLQADATALPLADDSVSMVFGSPPYEAARTYSMGFDLRGQAWVDWMVRVVRESLRVCRGLVAFVLEGQTRQYRWSATPALLMADLHRAGINLRKPPAFHRVGIPGSGGPDWLRNDYEFIVCATRDGKLPWSDNTACGGPPKFRPGGAMSNRNADGTRANDPFGFGGRSIRTRATGRVSVKYGEGEVERCGEAVKGTGVNENGHEAEAWVDGTGPAGPPSNRSAPPRVFKHFREDATGSVKGGHARDICAIANPGNVLKFNVGGGVMGHPLAHENEAPFPLALAEFFVKSFCPPNGTCLDVFSGSGTTMHAAFANGRNGIGIDIRSSQCELGRRRLASIPEPARQTELFQ